MSKIRIFALAAFVAVLVVTCSCSTSVSPKPAFKLPFLKDRPTRAKKLTCIWEAKMLAQKTNRVRGFQGEVMFFRDDAMKQSAMVDGTLIVYLFNDADKELAGAKPECEYRFDSEALKKCCVKNKMGMYSYGLWLPVDTMPGDEKTFSILAKFEGTGDDGELVHSELMKVVLTGNPVDKKKSFEQKMTEQMLAERSREKDSGNIRQASYNGDNGYSDDDSDETGLRPTAYRQALQQTERSQKSHRETTTLAVSPQLANQIFRNPEKREPSEMASDGTNDGTMKNTSKRMLASGFGGGDDMFAGNNDSMNSTMNYMTANYMTAGANQIGVPYAGEYRQNQPAAQNTGTQNIMEQNISQAASQSALQDTAADRSFGSFDRPLMLSRFQSNISTIGGQIEQRMQNSMENFADPQQAIQQASYNTANSGAANGMQQQIQQQSMQQAMAQMLAAQSRSPVSNPNINEQGFSERNSNNFTTEQNRVAVRDRYESWGVSPPQPQQPVTGQQVLPNQEVPSQSTLARQQQMSAMQAMMQAQESPPARSVPNQFPPQAPGTVQSSYVESDWGPGLAGTPSSRETRVLYSKPGEDRIYR
ncbi:MAG: hypothetical protein FWC50_13370 [Planctomycetaceae bacterium]|nr:hypothetical protein [Planctomycetaceae bacterium]